MQTVKLIPACALVVIVALIVVVGLVSHGVVRHVVQTLPVWLIVFAGFRDSPLTKWIALPVFIIWFLLMFQIWLFLLGIASILQGNFTPVETAMTIVVGLASAMGIVSSLRLKSEASTRSALLWFILVAIFQIGVVLLSFRPTISNDTAFLAWIGH